MMLKVQLLKLLYFLIVFQTTAAGLWPSFF